VAQSLENCDFQLRNLIIWAKNNFAISRGNYHHKHEPCWYGVRKGSTAQWIGDHSQTTLWEIDKPQKSETGHGTQKPVECMSRPMLNHEGDVYDPFLGSHTTLIACEQNKRTCYGQELNPAYVDVGVRRWLTYMRDNNRPYTVKRNGVLLTETELAQFE
jgi:DNA modification methylase